VYHGIAGRDAEPERVDRYVFSLAGKTGMEAVV